MTDPGLDSIMLMGISCRVECLISSWGQLRAEGLIGPKGVAQCHCESLGLWRSQMSLAPSDGDAWKHLSWGSTAASVLGVRGRTCFSMSQF